MLAYNFKISESSNHLRNEATFTAAMTSEGLSCYIQYEIITGLLLKPLSQHFIVMKVNTFQETITEIVHPCLSTKTCFFFLAVILSGCPSFPTKQF